VLKENASKINIRADRTADQLDQLTSQHRNFRTELEQMRRDSVDLIEMSRWMVERVRQLKTSFERSTPPRNKQQFINDAERLLAILRKSDADNA